MRLRCFLFLVAVFISVYNLMDNALAAESPAPGKQVAQTAVLPANTNYSKPATEEERKAEKARRDALSQEQRNAEQEEHLAKLYKDMRFPKPLSDTETQTVSYWLFLPTDYQPAKKYPLLLFLHGAGERGDNIDKVKVHGPPNILSDPEKAKDWQFITVSPQCPEGYSWSPIQLAKLLDEVEKSYSVDKNRIYVTGLSLGGFGTYGLLYHFPNRFAAGAPICGGFDPAVPEMFVNTPIWVFHGAKDKGVKLHLSTDIVDAIRAKGGEKVKLTVYPDLEHDSWTVTYNTPELYRWLLEQERETKKRTVPASLRFRTKR